MLGWHIRLSVRVAVGAVVVSITAPGAAHAAPTPVPPRVVGVAASPALAPAPALRSASPSPAHNPAATPSATATRTATATATATPHPTATPNTMPLRTSTPAPADDQPAEGSDLPESEAELDWQAFVPTDVADHLATMDRAARDSGCGVPWQLLAAIARVESDFGRNMATSSAGAIGYGQFLPSSWRAFGSDGNVYDYRAALPAIATYLCHSGLASDPRAALFAYNHADWYVDLVLDLAVRYDRMAPGAPIPEVLAVNPSDEQIAPMHYAPGRDVGLEARARALDGQATWLGVPWRGRPPGSSLSAASLETTSLAMLRAAFGLAGDPPEFSERASDRRRRFVDRVWAGGLLANPSALGMQWSVAEIHQRLERGQAVVTLVNPDQLPGHLSGDSEATGDQPVVVVGVTPDGLIYNDPSFSSSLGYGLELDDATFLDAWQAASAPLQALAISTRPAPPLRDDSKLEPRVFIASIVPTPAPRPVPTPVATPILEPTVTPPNPVAAAEILPATEDTSPTDSPSPPIEEHPDRSRVVLAGAAILLSAATVLRRLRARRLL